MGTAVMGTDIERFDALVRAVTDAVVIPASADESQLLTALDAVGAARRLLDAAAAGLVAEIEARDALDTAQSISRRQGCRGTVGLAAERALVDPAVASAWLAAGSAMSPRVSLTGERLPPAHGIVGEGLVAGRIDAATARSIAAAIDQCAVSRDIAESVEHELVEICATLQPRAAASLCRRVVADYAPLDAERREAALRGRRGLRVSRLPDGMTRVTIDADPESAGFILTALDARSTPSRTPGFDQDPDDKTIDDNTIDVETIDDPRTMAQRRLDALTELCRESIGRDEGEVGGTSVTVLVTVPLETLVAGVGSATIAGVDEPVCAGTVRRLAADAEIIPVVLGGPSEPLDLGESRRFFSRAQRRAMAVRDGGCLFPGCDAPPGRCEAAHVVPWARRRGPTDLVNGILLCRFHHLLFDTEGWQFEWRDGVPWFIPPRWIDPTRRPRRGGRARLRATA